MMHAGGEDINATFFQIKLNCINCRLKCSSINVYWMAIGGGLLLGDELFH